MKLRIFVILIPLLFCGCTTAHKKERAMLAEDQRQAEIASQLLAGKKSAERLEFIRSQSPDSKFHPSSIAEVDSLFHLMGVIQDGKLTSKQLEGISFFFRNKIGRDIGMFFGSEYFQCAQVLDLKNDNEEKNLYQGIYVNPHINITVSVLWENITPLVGQKLNTDFLVYKGVESYKNTEGDNKTMIKFIRPSWAD